MSSPLSSGLYPSCRGTPFLGETIEIEDAYGEIERRLMRVKVLYTFDDQNKSNCLARLPSVANIPTVQIDEGAQIGVIELKTCIQAIVSASPELVAKLGHDYTVYAYDYSEYETPLVGQGMLSWVLASASPTPNAPAHESKTMITGRVCKNILGLFSNGIKETLEVKLKLVPVPTCLQSEYLDSMEKYRNLSKVIPQDFDNRAWSAFLKENPDLHPAPRNGGAPILGNALEPNQPSGTGGIESIHRLLTQPINSADLQRTENGSFKDSQNLSMSQLGSQISRPQSAASIDGSFLGYPDQFPESRPVSRASNRSESQPFHQNTIEERHVRERGHDEGPARKRARITQTGWRGKSSFGSNGESLRVAASTAASIRVHRPNPSNPGLMEGSLEPPPRAPTPRPGGLSRSFSASQSRAIASSSLRRSSMSTANGLLGRYVSPYANQEQLPDPINDDDQLASAGETPMEFPSSPPIMQYGDPSPAPSSPALPTIAHVNDSGFVSDLPTDACCDADVAKAPDRGDLLHAQQKNPTGYTSHTYKNLNQPWTAIMPGPAELLPKKILLTNTTDSKEQKKSASRIDDGELPSLKPGRETTICTSSEDKSTKPAEESREVEAKPKSIEELDENPNNLSAKDALTPGPCAISPPTSAQDSESKQVNGTPSNPRRKPTVKPRKLPRSQTWSGENSRGSTQPPSDANQDECQPARPQQPRSGSGAKRSKTISNNLEESIAAGEMPRYCRNCGEIKTSTWRKAFTKVLQGTPGNVRLSSETGGVVGVEVVCAEDNDTNPKYRIFKKVLHPFEKDIGGFECLQLCNPCGLWFDKYGNMRPPTRWEKKEPNPNKRRRTAGNKRKKGGPDEEQGESIADLSLSAHNSAGNKNKPSHEGHLQNRTATELERSRSSLPDDDSTKTRLGESVAVDALRRAIKSSPAKFLGTEDSPIDLESSLTPKPTRRLLFPSPRKEGEIKTLSVETTATSPSMREQQKEADSVNGSPEIANNDKSRDNDKENCPPSDVDDDLAHLFEDGELNILQSTPKNRRTLENLLKTPSSTRSQSRNPLTPRNYFGASALNRDTFTPSRSSVRGMPPPLTPFTAHLNMLLSEGISSSPSNAFDFSVFPTISHHDMSSNAALPSDDFLGTDLDTDLPLTSSSPNALFSLYEDPATSTIGIWSEADYFTKTDGPENNSDDTRGGLHSTFVRHKTESPGRRNETDGHSNTANNDNLDEMQGNV